MHGATFLAIRMLHASRFFGGHAMQLVTCNIAKKEPDSTSAAVACNVARVILLLLRVFLS